MSNDDNDRQDRPSARFASPLFRFKLVNPARTNLGYHLIDVIAVLPPVKDKTSKFPFPYYICLALGTNGKWTDLHIVDGDGHCDLGEAYEVVS